MAVGIQSNVYVLVCCLSQVDYIVTHTLNLLLIGKDLGLNFEADSPKATEFINLLISSNFLIRPSGYFDIELDTQKTTHRNTPDEGHGELQIESIYDGCNLRIRRLNKEARKLTEKTN